VLARIQLALAAALAVAAVVLAVLLVSGGGDDGPAAPAELGVGPSGFVGALRPEIPPQDFRLTDQDGRRVALSDFRGEVVALTFLYTTCEDTCPLTTSQIRGALDDLGEDVPVLAVSVDPPGDTPVRARRFLLDQRMTGRMSFLLGSPAELEPVWKAYGIQPQGRGKEAFDHSAHVVLIDREGRQRIGHPVSQLRPEGLAHDLRALQAEPETRRAASGDPARQ
jgi:protein SCO1/2